MEIGIHNKILRDACALAKPDTQGVYDPRIYLPFLIRGSWISDMNQSTLFTALKLQPAELEDAKRKAFDDAAKRLFAELWKQEYADVLREMDNDAKLKDIVGQSKQIDANQASASLGDFGFYNRLDHFDIVDTDALKEKPKPDADRNIGLTIEKGISLANDRLVSCLEKSPSERWTWNTMSTLGQVLHTVADFFAHTNYIEMLLWSLSRLESNAGKLDDATISVFVGPCLQRKKEEPWDYVCPLPDVNAVPSEGAFFYYGDDPGGTQVVSSIFDLTDTLCFLLDSYAAHLRNIETSVNIADKQRYLDVAMAVVDLSGSRKNMVSAIGNLYLKADAIVFEVGRIIRQKLAAKIKGFAANKTGTEKRVLEMTSSLVEMYSNSEMIEWQKAGGYEYVLNCFYRDMLEKLSAHQASNTFALPHHTLLRKDVPALRTDHALRFALACTFATAATQHILESLTRIESDPEAQRSNSKKLLQTIMMHPQHQVIRSASPNNELSRAISVLRGQQWPFISNYESIVKVVKSWIFMPQS